MADEARRLFESLADDSLREVVRLRLEGYSNDEIARALDCGLRTVERKLAGHPQALGGRGGRMSDSRIGSGHRPGKWAGDALGQRGRGD